jgi:uncharacterized alkaline shock family protein YloU
MNLRAAEKESPTSGSLRSARDRGRIEVFPAVVGAIAGHAAVGCYGVMGMAARGLRDGVATLLRRENVHRGVEVHEVDGQLVIDLYVVVLYGVRITEVAQNLKSAVRFDVERATAVQVAEVNVFVQGVHGDTGIY